MPQKGRVIMITRTVELIQRACDECTQGVLDQGNSHWGARCSCICHICDHDSASGIDRSDLDAAEKRWICEACGTVFTIVPAVTEECDWCRDVEPCPEAHDLPQVSSDRPTDEARSFGADRSE